MRLLEPANECTSSSERAYRARLLKWGFTKYTTGTTPLPKRKRIPRPTSGGTAPRPLAPAALTMASPGSQVYQDAPNDAAG
jgi:hypothetical protein